MSPLPLLVAAASLALLGLACGMAPPPPDCPGGGPFGVGCDLPPGHEPPCEVARAGRRFARPERPPHVEGAAPEARIALRVLLLLVLAAAAAAAGARRRSAPPGGPGPIGAPPSRAALVRSTP